MPIIIGNIYRPPNKLVDFYNEFISELSPVLKSFENNESAFTFLPAKLYNSKLLYML